jgi:two-component system phosphate regulon sensor histidine kinase PhoR
MFAQLLGNNLSSSRSAKTNEYLEIIEGESDRLRRLIDNVLDFSKIERGIKQYNFNRVEFNELVKNVLLLMDYQFKMADIKLSKQLSDSEVTINADKDAVEQAMINLLSNAIKYSDRGTTVTIFTGEQNGFVFFKVADQGIGISTSEKEKIFNPFFRSTNNADIKAEGTGLGLAIVRHILDAHSGRIEVESTPGKGSTFILLFSREA